MNKNKIIGNIYKKLLANNFDHDDIRKLLFCYEDFYSFNNFIFYLFKSATSKNKSLQHEMCKSILSYLEYLIYINHIEDFDTNILKINSFYHEIEINSLKNTINLLSIDEKEIDLYKDTIFIFKILPLQKDVHIFINNEYRGVYRAVKHINYFVKDVQTVATLFFNTLKISEYSWQEINNFIISRYWDSLSMFKNNLISILNKNKIVDNKIYDNIYNSTNHFSCINIIISFLIWTNNKNIYDELISHYGNYFLNYKFDISLLFDSISYISSQELVLLCNGFEILWGNHFSIDYKNNVYICIEEIKYNEKNQLIIYLFDNYDHKYFDSTINKLILNTINNENKLYIFHKKNNDKFLYLGNYKVKGIEFDLNNKPFFKLNKIIPEINFNDTNYVTNNYLNAFYNSFFSHQNYIFYSNQQVKLPTSSIDISIDKMNSLLFKYNWVINKYMNTQDSQYAVAYQKFETTLILNISNVINNQYKIVFENKFIKNWAIASEIYNNTHNKELQQIIFIDSPISISDQNKIIEKILYIK